MITSLLDLTTYIWAGWPRGVATVQQNSVGHIVGTYTTGKKRPLRNDPLPLVSDWRTAIVSKEDFYAAVDKSLRYQPVENINYLPVASAPVAPPELTMSQDFMILKAQYNELNAAYGVDPEKLLLEIARLQILFRDVLSVHVISDRERRRLSANSVKEQETLLWLSSRHIGAWPVFALEGGEVLRAKYITQAADGKIIAHMEYNNTEHPWLQDALQVPLAKDIIVGGYVNKITEPMWVKARTDRILQDNANQARLKDAAEKAVAHSEELAPVNPVQWVQNGEARGPE